MLLILIVTFGFVGCSGGSGDGGSPSGWSPVDGKLEAGDSTRPLGSLSVETLPSDYLTKLNQCMTTNGIDPRLRTGQEFRVIFDSSKVGAAQAFTPLSYQTRKVAGVDWARGKAEIEHIAHGPGEEGVVWTSRCTVVSDPASGTKLQCVEAGSAAYDRLKAALPAPAVDRTCIMFDGATEVSSVLTQGRYTFKSGISVLAVQRITEVFGGARCLDETGQPQILSNVRYVRGFILTKDLPEIAGLALEPNCGSAATIFQFGVFKDAAGKTLAYSKRELLDAR